MPPLEWHDPYQGEGEGDQEVFSYKIARIQAELLPLCKIIKEIKIVCVSCEKSLTGFQKWSYFSGALNKYFTIDFNRFCSFSSDENLALCLFDLLFLLKQNN